MADTREILLRVLTVGASLVIMLGLLEVGLRLAGIQPVFFFQPDPEVGGIHQPNLEGWWTFEHGRRYIRINSHGYRDYEREVKKPEDTYRVAVLGDSFIEAFHVELEESLTAVLEKRLTQSCGTPMKFEVLNFGVSGFGTAQELETLRRRALPFEPDLVLLFFYPSNDLFDNSRELGVEPNRLYYDLDPNGELVKLPFEVSDWPLKRWLRHHSKAYLFLRERLKRLQALRRALVKLRLAQKELPPAARREAEKVKGLQESQYVAQLPPAIERAWRLTSALLEAARDLAEEHGAGFGLVVIPNKQEVLSASAPYRQEAGLDYQRSIAEIQSICDRLRLDCLQLVRAFSDSELTLDQLYFPRDGHWSAAGHALTAEETFAWLRQRACS